MEWGDREGGEGGEGGKGGERAELRAREERSGSKI